MVIYDMRFYRIVFFVFRQDTELRNLTYRRFVMTNIHTQESGRSMIEMLGVLAIIGVLSVGGIAGYSQAMNKFKVSKTIDQIQTMVQNIRTLYSGQKTYSMSTNTNALLKAAGVFNDEICPYGETCSVPMNPYGGSITVSSLQDDIGRTDRAFYIAYDSLPNTACVALATQGWGDASSGLVAVTAGRGTSTGGTKAPTATAVATNKATHVTKNQDVPMNLNSATTGCGTGGGATSYLILYYK